MYADDREYQFCGDAQSCGDRAGGDIYGECRANRTFGSDV
jgi:hypothetical protein